MKLSLSSLPSGVKRYQLSLYGYDRDLCKPADSKDGVPTRVTASDRAISRNLSILDDPNIECFEDVLVVGHWSEMLDFD